MSDLKLQRWRDALFLIFALSGLSVASWVARLPAVRDRLHIDTAQVGLLIFSMSVGSIVGLVLAPPLLQRLGPRRGMLACLCATAGGLLVVALPTNPLVVASGLALFGFGNGAVDVMMNVEAAAAERALGKTVMPMMHAFFSLGTVAGAGLGALASWLSVGVFTHLGLTAMLVVLGGLLAVPAVPEHPGEDQARPHLPARERLRAGLAVWPIGLIMLGMAFAEGSANDWLALAVVDGHGQSNTTGAAVLCLFVAAMTLGRVSGGSVLDRFGRVPVLQAGSLLAIAGLLAFILSPRPWLVCAGAALWGLGCSLGFPVGMSAAADSDDPRQSAARVSAVAILGYCAFLVGPPGIGALGQRFGILNALYAVLALAALAGLASPAARERVTNRAGR